MRPLTAVEVLDAAWLLLRRNWIRFYAASSIGTAPLAILIMLYFRWLGTIVQGTDDAVFYTGTAVWAVGMALAWGVNGAARGVVTAQALADARGKARSPAELWRLGLRHMAGTAFIGLFTFAAVWLAAPCLIAPGLGLALAWMVARPVLLTEERRYLAALRRSWRLTEGYRGKALALWIMLTVMWLMGAVNLHLFIGFLLGTTAGFLGIDTSALQAQLTPQNETYVTVLLVALFILLDPLKTAADAILYLDLRIRREGADLQERLRALRAGAAAAAALLLLVTASPAAAVTVEEYLARVRALRERVSRVRSAERIDPSLVRELRSAPVQIPGGQKITVENDWLPQALEGWKKPSDREGLLQRLDALERSLSGFGPAATTAGSSPGQPAVPAQGSPGTPPTPAEIDPKQTLGKILAEPEFQPLAERPELRELAKKLDLSQTRSWWDSFWDWVRKSFFRPAPPQPVQAPSGRAPDMRFLEPVFYVLLGLAAVFLLALLIRAFMDRPARAASAKAVTTEAPPLEASATENALDHTVDEWELFAQEWLGRGDVRQAIRALYLATLVHLHRERRIDYNRALTNWVYVRQFRGEAEQKGTLEALTRVFDEVWYGERPCGEAHYRAFEQGARALGTPAPAAPVRREAPLRPAHA